MTKIHFTEVWATYYSIHSLETFAAMLLFSDERKHTCSTQCSVNINTTLDCGTQSSLSYLCIIAAPSDANQQPCWNVIAIQQISCTLINSPAGIVAQRRTGALLGNKTKA